MRPLRALGIGACLLLASAVGCTAAGTDEEQEYYSLKGGTKWHTSHDGDPPWPHILTCYGGCAAPHYDPSACGGSTACCSSCIDGTWWYSTEQQIFGCGAKLEIRRDDRCVIVEVADNGPASWVEDDAAAACGVGAIIDTSPLVNDYFGGGCGWSECFQVMVRPVAGDLPQGICPSCPCDGPPAAPQITIAIAIEDVSGQERDFCALGGSSGIFDMGMGQQTRQNIDIRSAGPSIARGTRVKIEIQQPCLVGTFWEIYSDWGHPGTFELNDSNDLQPIPHENPAASFELTIGSLSSGETKRIPVTVQAAQPSFGVLDPGHAAAKAFVSHIDDFYDKDTFDGAFNDHGSPQNFIDRSGQQGNLRDETATDIMTDEICANGIDDDCSGLADDGCICAPGEVRECGQGACKGSQTCEGTGWGDCAGGSDPAAEICGDGIDNDCDGQTDEDCGGDTTMEPPDWETPDWETPDGEPHRIDAASDGPRAEGIYWAGLEGGCGCAIP